MKENILCLRLPIDKLLYVMKKRHGNLYGRAGVLKQQSVFETKTLHARG